MAQQRINYYGKIRPANIDDLSVKRVEAVAGVIQDVADVGLKIATGMQQKRAVKDAESAAAQALETGEAPTPQDRTFSAINAYDQTYNDTLKKSYLAGAETQAREKINTLAVSFADDYKSFDASATALRNGMLQGLPEEYRPAMQIQMDAFIGSKRPQVLAAQKARVLAAADDQFVLSANDAMDNAITSLQSGNLIEAVTLTESANQIIDDRVTSKAITPAAGEMLKRENTLKLRVGTARATLNNILTSGEPGAFTNAIGYVAGLQSSDQFADLTQVERDSLITSARSDLSQALTLDNQTQTRLDTRRKVAQEQNYFDASAAIISGELDASGVLMLAQTRAIDQSQYEKLNTKLSNVGSGVDDYNIIFDIQNKMKTDPEGARQDVINAQGSSLTQATATNLLKSIDGGTGPLGTERAKIFRKFLTSNFGQINPLTGKWGGAATKELGSRAMMAYDLRVLNGEDPGEVARSLFDISDIEGVSDSKDANAQLQESLKLSNKAVQNLINGGMEQEDAIESYLNSKDGTAATNKQSKLRIVIGRLEQFEKMNAEFSSGLITTKQIQEVEQDNG